MTPTIDENGVVTLSGRIEDAGERDTHQVTIVWGDGTSETVAVDPVTRTFGTTHRYGDDAASAGVPSGRYTVSVTASDGQGGSGTVTLPDAVDVKNVAPTVVGLNVTPTIDENGVVTLSGRIEDAGERDTHQVTIVWGDGTSETVAVDPVTRTFGTTHRYGDDAASAGVPSGRYTVSVTASDGQGGSGTVTLPDAVDVKNVAPVITAYNVTGGSFTGSATLRVDGIVADPGANDNVGVEIDWGDGVISYVTVDRATGQFTASRLVNADAVGAPTDGRWVVRATAIDNTGQRGPTQAPTDPVRISPTTTMPMNTSPPAPSPSSETSAAPSVMNVAYSGSTSDSIPLSWGSGPPASQIAPPTQTLPASQPPRSGQTPPANSQGGGIPTDQPQDGGQPGGQPSEGAPTNGGVPQSDTDPLSGDRGRSDEGNPAPVFNDPSNRGDGEFLRQTVAGSDTGVLQHTAWLALTARSPDAIRVKPDISPTKTHSHAGDTALLIGTFGMVAISNSSSVRRASASRTLRLALAELERDDSWSLSDELPEDWHYEPALGSLNPGE